MDIKITFCVLLAVIMNLHDTDAIPQLNRYRRSPGELGIPSGVPTDAGRVSPRIWRRAATLKKSTKSNEAIPDSDAAWESKEPVLDFRPAAVSSPDTVPPPAPKKKSPKNAPDTAITRISLSPPPGATIPRNANRNTKKPPKPEPESNPNSLENPDDPTDNENRKKSPKPEPEPTSSSDNPSDTASRRHLPPCCKQPPPYIKNNRPGNPKPITAPPQAFAPSTERPKYPENDGNQPENPEDSEKDEENGEDEKEAEEPTEDPLEVDNEPEEPAEDEREPEEPNEEPEEPNNERGEPTEDEKEPEEPNDEAEEPESEPDQPEEEPAEDDNPPPPPTARPRRPPPTPKPTRPPPPFPGSYAPYPPPKNPLQPPPNRPRPRTTPKPTPAFEYDEPTDNGNDDSNPDSNPLSQNEPDTKNTRKLPPGLKTNTGKTARTTPRPVPDASPEDPSEPEDEQSKPDDDTVPEPSEDDAVEEKTPAPTKRRPGPKYLPPNSRPRPNPSSIKRPSKRPNPAEPPQLNDDDGDQDPETPEPVQDEEDDFRETTPRPAPPRRRPSTKKGSRTPDTRERPSRPVKTPSNPASDDDPETAPNFRERFGDDEPETESQTNQTKSSNPYSTPPYSNPAHSGSPSWPPFGFGSAGSFASAGPGAGASASSSASAGSFGSPTWEPWPRFFNGQFPDNPPSTNPFLNPVNSRNLPFYPPYDNNRPQPKGDLHSPKRGAPSPKGGSPLPNNSSDAPSSAPKSVINGYTPIIDISGTFDFNDPPVTGASHSKSPLTSQNDNQTPPMSPRFASESQPTSNPGFSASFSSSPYGQVSGSNANYGNPAGAGSFASAGSFAGASASGYPSPMSGYSYSGANDVFGNGQGSPGLYDIGTPFSNPNFGQDHFNSIFAQNDAMMKHMQGLMQQQQQSLNEWATQSLNRGQAMPTQGQTMPTQYQTMPTQYQTMPTQSQVRPTLDQSSMSGQTGPTYYGSERFSPSYEMNGLQPTWGGFTYGQQPQQTMGPNAGYFPDAGGFPGSGGSGFAFGSASAGPHGLHQAGAIGPASPNFESRFSDSQPSSGGSSYGTFSSSSSISGIGPDGKVVNREVSTTGINDNGKIYSKTVHN